MNAQNNQRRGSEGDGGVEIRQPAPCGVEGTPDPARPNKQPPKGKWCPAQPCGEWRRAGGCGQRGYRRGEALVEGTGIGGGQCGDDPLRREHWGCVAAQRGHSPCQSLSFPVTTQTYPIIPGKRRTWMDPPRLDKRLVSRMVFGGPCPHPMDLPHPPPGSIRPQGKSSRGRRQSGSFQCETELSEFLD